MKKSVESMKESDAQLDGNADSGNLRQADKVESK